jgi:hypothetical protein
MGEKMLCHECRRCGQPFIFAIGTSPEARRQAIETLHTKEVCDARMKEQH